MDAVRRFAGKLFHTRGPATAKLHVLSAVLVLGTTRHLLSYSDDNDDGVDKQCQLYLCLRSVLTAEADFKVFNIACTCVKTSKCNVGGVWLSLL